MAGLYVIMELVAMSYSRGIQETFGEKNQQEIICHSS